MRSVRHLGLPDWLKERRLELGLPAEAEVYEPQLTLLLKGALVGVVLALSPIVLVVQAG